MNRIEQIMRKPLSDTDLKSILGEDTRLSHIPSYPNITT
jgi:hypothetical protein